jgi:hypothetical protein
LFLSSATPLKASDYQSDDPVARFIVANLVRLCHKRSLHRPADQGLPWQMFLRVVSLLEIAEHFQSSNEHFSRESAASGGSFLRP